MGRYRFKLSAMVPNAWFYKLNDMGRRNRKQCNNTHPPKKQYPTTQPKQKHHSHPRPSNQSKVYNTERNQKASSERRTKGIPVKPSSSKLLISSVSVDCNCSSLVSVRNPSALKIRGKEKAEEIPV
ncbi:hypothetical protein NE237_001510 [Protea cynaroides]|uniref:DNA-binding domain-containing protein n=1 Tax=Protea cynaroides TaxID=273540 RepID=A0A9Q0KUA7_9MAGN|nr:hypothetical protein NE237_001510 [Protea cynaroides]